MKFINEVQYIAPYTGQVWQIIPEELSWTLQEYSLNSFLFNISIVHNLTHAISVVGWGEENGTKFWRVRNSRGSAYGELGYFRIIRGVNNLGIE